LFYVLPSVEVKHSDAKLMSPSKDSHNSTISQTFILSARKPSGQALFVKISPVSSSLNTTLLEVVEKTHSVFVELKSNPSSHVPHSYVDVYTLQNLKDFS